jgi:hypothetical protein
MRLDAGAKSFGDFLHCNFMVPEQTTGELIVGNKSRAAKQLVAR